jgi:O-antigen/teichoic acid export membrane protein
MEPLPQIPAEAEAVVQPLPRVTPRPAADLLRRAGRWAKILSAYFTAQTLTQLAGIAAGLLLIRFLPVREFALYTLASSMITFFTFASDLGSTTSLLYFFNRAAKTGEDFRSYFAAVLSLRRLAFVLGLVIIALVFPATAAAKGFGVLETGLAILGIALSVLFQIDASLRVLALRLKDRYGASYGAELTGAGLRLFAALLMVAGGLLFGWLGVLAAALGPAATSLLAHIRDEKEEPAPDVDLKPYRRRVLRYLLPTLPSALYFAVQSPLVVWLAATFGSTRNIAEVGALGRLGLAVGLFSSLTGVLFLPRLARITDDRLYRARYLQFGGLLLAIAAAIFAAALAVPELFLLILGESYAGLHRELLLVVGAAGLTLLDGYCVAVNLARSWTRWQGAAVLSLALSQALLVALLPLSTTSGVLLLTLLSSGVALAGQLAINWIGFARPRWVHWE